MVNFVCSINKKLFSSTKYKLESRSAVATFWQYLCKTVKVNKVYYYVEYNHYLPHITVSYERKKNHWIVRGIQIKKKTNILTGNNKLLLLRSKTQQQEI